MNILIVEDDVKTAEFVERAFREDGFTTVVARDGEEALSRVRIGDFDVAVVDIMLPKLDGLSLIRAIRKSGRTFPVIVLSALGSVEYVVVHELTHLRVANHGPEFKALMDERMPDWRERRKALNTAPDAPAGS